MNMTGKAFLAVGLVPALCIGGSVASDATHRLTVTANDSVLSLGRAVEDGVPILVRLSASVPGFSYDDVAEGGANLFFTDESGERLPHEIDTWNTEGESLVWVRVPRLTGSTKLYAWYGGSSVASNATDVWKGYVGVWHLNERGSAAESTSVLDSTANGLNAIGIQGAKSSDGVLGGGWTISTDSGHFDQTGGLLVPKKDVMNVSPNFTVSGWVRRAQPNDKYDWSYLISRKENDGTQAWGLQFASGGSCDRIRMWYGGKVNGGYEYFARNNNPNGDFANSFGGNFKQDTWTKFTAVYFQDPATGGYVTKLYINDTAQQSTGYCQYKPYDGDHDLYIGGGWSLNSLVGEMDEVRFYAGAMTKARAALDYAMESNTEAFRLSDVREASAAPLFAQPRFSVVSDGVRLTASLTQGSAKIVARVNGSTCPVSEAVVTAGQEVSVLLPGVSADRAFTCVLEAQDESGNVLTTREASVNGVVSVAKLADANEDGLVAGGFTVTCLSSVAEDLEVNYTLGGSAVNGVAYEELSGSVTIPAGSSSATIPVKPLWSPVETPCDTRVEVTLASGSYIVAGGTARIKLLNKEVGEAAKFAHAVRLDIGYAGNDPVADVAIPVRISEARVPGFSYADFLKDDFSDLAVLDDNGAYLPYDVEKLDPNGESVIWIRFAELAKGTSVYLVYGSKKTLPNLKAQMWPGYAGVWHLSDNGSGTEHSPIADATANGLVGTAYAAAHPVAGVVGGGWMISDDTAQWKQGQNHGCIKVPAQEALNVAPVFTVSGWVKCYLADKWWGYLISRKEKDYTNGWGLQFSSEKVADGIRLWYDGNSGGEHQKKLWYKHLENFLPDQWCGFTAVYGKDDNGYYGTLYLNGEKASGPEYFDYEPKDGDFDLIIGGTWNDNTVSGEMDEVRISKGVRTPEQIAVEYAAESNPGYVTVGVARELPRDPKGFIIFVR